MSDYALGVLSVYGIMWLLVYARIMRSIVVNPKMRKYSWVRQAIATLLVAAVWPGLALETIGAEFDR